MAKPGVKAIAAERPWWLQAAGAVNESGGVSVTVAGVRLYPIQVAEKGLAPYRIRVRGTWGHGSMPREDNAAVLTARIVERLAVLGPVRVTPVMARFLDVVAAALPRSAGTAIRRLGDGDPSVDAEIDGLCEPMYALALRALLLDTLSPDVITAGVKFNVVPGDAVIETDCRVLPGMTAADALALIESRIGPDLRRSARSSRSVSGLRSRRQRTARCGTSWSRPSAITSGRRARTSHGPIRNGRQDDRRSGHANIRVLALRLAPNESYLERYHGVDERVAIDALRFGLPVLYDVTRRFCA